MIRKIKKSLALILSILMLMSVVPMNIAFAAVDGQFVYNAIDETTAEVIGYKGTSAEIVIPSKVKTYTVVSVSSAGSYPFKEKANITSVVIPDTVTKIDKATFAGCTNLKTVTIGAGVVEIQQNAFNGCNSVETVNYAGSPEQWNAITWGANNNVLKRCENIVYYYGYDCGTSGHKEIKSVDAKAETCTEDGNISYWYCDVCKDKFSDEALTIPATDVVIPAIHKTLQKTEATEADCTTAGNHAYWYCATCGKYFADANTETEYKDNSHVITTNNNHDYVAWYHLDNTTTHKRYCKTNNSHTETENCFDSATDNDCNCDVCGYFVAHDFADATCVARKTCKVCNTTEGEFDTNKHNLTKVDAKAFTCTEAGNKEYWLCLDCNKYFKDADGTVEYEENEWVISAAHSLISFALKNPTCTENGYSAHYKCTVCKATFKDALATNPIDPTKPATGHKTTKVDAVAKTCTTDGNIEHWNCTVCNKKFEDQEATRELKDVVVPASHEMKFVEDVRATCTSEGKKEHYLCTACSKIFGDINGKIELDEREITTVKPHDGYSEKAKAPTCTEDGHITYVGCYTCGKLFTDKDFKTEIKIENTVIPALTHDWSSNYIDGKDGKHYKPCRRNGCNAVNEDSAEAHVWNSGEIIKDSTCTELGTMKYTCTIANCNATRTEEIEKKPHTEVYYKQPATCTEDGKEGEKWCTVCEKFTAEAETIPALGHDWESIGDHTFATCIENASGDRHCKRCDITETDTTEALGHTYPENWTPKRPATCDEAGLEIKLCEVCKTAESVISNSLPALNHKGFDTYVIDENEVDGTCTTKATWDKVTYCRGCDTELTRVKKTGDKDFTNHIDIETGLSYGETTGPENYVPGNCITKATWDEVTRCNGCNEVIRSIPQEAATVGDHNLVKTNAVAPTCEEDGNIDYWTCSLCNKIYSDEEAGTVIVIEDTVDPAIGHAWGDWKYNGNNEHKRVCANDAEHIDVKACNDSDDDNDCLCDVCDELVEHDFAEATCIAEQICRVCKKKAGKINSENHISDRRIVNEDVVDGTCKTAAIWNEVTYCNGCNAKLNTEPKTGAKDTTNHVGGVHTENKNIVEGTCKAAKTWNEVTYCNDCNAELGSVAKTGNKNPANHVGGVRKAEENVVAGTCKTERKWNEVTYCKGCNDKLNTEPKTGSKDPNNHKWSEEVTEHYRECENGCTAKLPVEHSYEGDFRTVKYATCKEAGLKVKYCKYCHDDVEFEIAKTNDHTDSNKDYKCDLCEIELEKPGQDEAETDTNKPAQDPSANCSCNCHKSGMANLVFRIILFFQKLFGANKTCVCGKSHY